MSSTEYKVVILGQSGVGKSSLMNRLAGQPFHNHAHSTMGSPKKQFRLSDIHLGEEAPQFTFYDTSGQRQWDNRSEPALRKSQDGNTHAVIIALDMMNSPVDNQEIFAVFRELAQKEAPTAHIMVVLTKSDLAKHAQTRRESVQSWVDDPKVPVLETSAKELLNIQELKQTLANTCTAAALAMTNLPEEPPAPKTYDLTIRDLWKQRHNKTFLAELVSASTNPLANILKPQERFWKFGIVNSFIRYFLLKTKDFQQAALEKNEVYTSLYFPKTTEAPCETPRPTKIISSHSRFIQHGFVPQPAEDREENSIGSDYAEFGRKPSFVEESFITPPQKQPPIYQELKTISLG